MLFAVIFEDDPAHAEARARLMPEHLTFLDAHAAAIRAAGPLLPTADEPPGGLWLVEAVDEAEARALVERDPLWPGGIRKSTRIYRWRQVFRDGRRTT
jgi:uncharacterized protein YciI